MKELNLTPKQKQRYDALNRLGDIISAADPTRTIFVASGAQSGSYHIEVDTEIYADQNGNVRAEIVRQLMDLVAKITNVVSALETAYPAPPLDKNGP